MPAYKRAMILSNPALRLFASKNPHKYYSSIINLNLIIGKVIKVPKMGDSISEGTVQTFVKSKWCI
jgi:hypothetical protein